MLTENERFLKAREIVRAASGRPCLWSVGSDKTGFIAEAYVVGKTIVLVTAYQGTYSKDRDGVIVEVWSPVTNEIGWDDVRDELDRIKNDRGNTGHWQKVANRFGSLLFVMSTKVSHLAKVWESGDLAGAVRDLVKFAETATEDNSLSTNVYVHVQGGTVQGITGPPGLNAWVVDRDNEEVGDEQAQEENEQARHQEQLELDAGKIVPLF